MSEQVSVGVGAEGRPVAVKRTRDDDRRARLRHEAAMLEAAAHPGVVALVGLEDADGTTVLSTAWLGGGSIVAAHLAPKRLASAAAALATTLADLHARGIVHHRVDADHVLLDGIGRPVLLGFADATSAPDGRPADDVAGVGAVIDAALDADAIPVSRLRAATADRETVERLRAVVLRACDDDPTRRPSARALAGLLTEVAGEVEPARGPTRVLRPSPAPSRGTRGLTSVLATLRGRTGELRPPAVPKMGAALGALGVLAIVGFGAHAALAGGSSAAPPSTTAPPSTASSPTSASPSTTSLRVWPTTIACPAVTLEGDRRDIDGDGCPEVVTIDGAQLVVDGTRFDVGTPGDVLAVGDYDCDGRDTIAVLRPGTGEVFVFDEWATASNATTSRAIGIAAGAVRLAPPDGECGAVKALDAAGVARSLPFASAR